VLFVCFAITLKYIFGANNFELQLKHAISCVTLSQAVVFNLGLGFCVLSSNTFLRVSRVCPLHQSVVLAAGCWLLAGVRPFLVVLFRSGKSKEETKQLFEQDLL
jgi:hypothetical protein